MTAMSRCAGAITWPRWRMPAADAALAGACRRCYPTIGRGRAARGSMTHARSAWARLADVAYACAGVFACSFALKGFLMPNHFFDGGVTGVALLLHEVYAINIGVAVVVLN